jgi:predicted metal-dependent enzyme (double-stranded beta helix superfamily)
MPHTRRLALQLSAKALLGLLALPRLGHARGRDGALDWQRVLDQLSAMAEAQFNDGWDTESYVEDVAVLMRTLDLRDRHFRRFLRAYEDTAAGRPSIRRAHGGGHFSVATLHFEPGESIDLHDHPRMTGVILGLRGAARIDAFDRLDHPERPDRWRLRPAGQAVVGPGQHATLTPERGNVHALRADVFTELLDVFTPPYDEPRRAEFKWYTRAEAPSPDGSFEAWERPKPQRG